MKRRAAPLKNIDFHILFYTQNKIVPRFTYDIWYKRMYEGSDESIKYNLYTFANGPGDRGLVPGRVI